jgi:hypothetical protein
MLDSRRQRAITHRRLGPGATEHHLIDPKRSHDVLDLLLIDVREPLIKIEVAPAAQLLQHREWSAVLRVPTRPVRQ